jgi:hypothetical protein
LELVIATDTSRSIDELDARLQRQGVAAAFKSPEVMRALLAGAMRKIAVAYLDWSGGPNNRLVVDWTVIHDDRTASAFADMLMQQSYTRGDGTAIGLALIMAANLIELNAFDGTKKTIDISGDGPNNAGPPADVARALVVARGITINGLPIDSWELGTGDWGIYYGRIDAYYENCVIGGKDAFIVPAHGIADFASAMRQKLVLELLSANQPTDRKASMLVRTAAPQQPRSPRCNSGRSQR